MLDPSSSHGEESLARQCPSFFFGVCGMMFCCCNDSLLSQVISSTSFISLLKTSVGLSPLGISTSLYIEMAFDTGVYWFRRREAFIFFPVSSSVPHALSIPVLNAQLDNSSYNYDLFSNLCILCLKNYYVYALSRLISIVPLTLLSLFCRWGN